MSGTVASDEMLYEILSHSCSPYPCKQALKRLIGVSTFADDQRFSNIVEVISDIPYRFRGNLEEALAQKPDLIVVASFTRPEVLTKLKAIKIEVHVLPDIPSLDKLTASLLRLGEVIQEPDAARTVASNMATIRADLQTKRNSLPRNPTVLHVYPDGTVSGRGSLFDDLVREAGGQNVASERVSGWQKLAAEAYLKLDPDYVVVSEDPTLDRAKQTAYLLQLPGVKNLSAVRHRRFIFVKAAELTSVSPHVLKAAHAIYSGFLARSP
jgi:iron complex transport system substrate-binding protein